MEVVAGWSSPAHLPSSTPMTLISCKEGRERGSRRRGRRRRQKERQRRGRRKRHESYGSEGRRRFDKESRHLCPALGAKMRMPIDDEYHIGINTVHLRRESDGARVITGTRANSNFHDRVVGRMDDLARVSTAAPTPAYDDTATTPASSRLTLDLGATTEVNGGSPLSPSPANPAGGAPTFGGSSTNLSLVADLESTSTAVQLAEGGLPTQPSEVTLATMASTHSDTTNATCQALKRL